MYEYISNNECMSVYDFTTDILHLNPEEAYFYALISRYGYCNKDYNTLAIQNNLKDRKKIGRIFDRLLQKEVVTRRTVYITPTQIRYIYTVLYSPDGAIDMKIVNSRLDKGEENLREFYKKHNYYKAKNMRENK